MNTDLTIIIPCYNTQNYLERCIESIINQNYNDFELILIDDCSTDDTLKIIKTYAIKYNFIKYIENKKNMGAGYSRNEALKIVHTKYVTFIDSDDFIDNNYLEEHMKNIKKENADISICDIKVIYESNGTFEISECCDKAFNKKNIILSGLAASPCNKIFKKELFNENLFAEGIINEDIPAVIYSLIKSNKIIYVKDIYYNYIQRNSSVQNSRLSLKKLDIVKSMDLLKKRLSGREKDEYFDGLIFNQIILFLFYVVPKEIKFNQRYKFLRQFSKLIKKYKIKNNKYLQEFISHQGKKHQIYYNLFINLIEINFCLLANLLISFYQLYHKYFRINVLDKKTYNLELLIKEAKKSIKKEQKSLSVIIPNYNYEKFLIQRIYSVLNQKYLFKELIILDDKSSDNSAVLINKIYNALKDYINIKVIINDENSGSAFKQWKKGIKLASSDYIWICEADDYANKNMLKNIYKYIDNNSDIQLAYVNTGFIDSKGFLIQRNVNNDIDLLKTGHWDNDYINDGIDEIQKYEYLNCTIANVSSMIFKNNDYSRILNKCINYKQAGDWLFYYELMKQGKVCFIAKTYSYYRMHGNNATSTNKKNIQFEEIKNIHKIILEEQKLDEKQLENIEKREKFLKEVWKL
jgi:glycosyltransferase involved in cell wall biosynthesis